MPDMNTFYVIRVVSETTESNGQFLASICGNYELMNAVCRRPPRGGTVMGLIGRQ